MPTPLSLQRPSTESGMSPSYWSLRTAATSRMYLSSVHFGFDIRLEETDQERNVKTTATYCAFLLQKPTGLMSSPSISSEVLFNKFSMVNPCAFSLSIAAKFTYNVVILG